MIDRDETYTGGGELPPDLEELHRSLSSIRLEERPSFGPELRAELEKAWIRRSRAGAGPAVGRNAWWGIAAAAVLLLTVSAPPARAALARILEWVPVPELTEAPAEEPAVPPVRGEPRVGAAGAGPEPSEGRIVAADDGEDLQLELPVVPLAVGGQPGRTSVNALPRLLDRDRAASLIQSHYPVDLQRRGVGGTVRLLLYVEPDGRPEHVRIRRGSGVDALDRAAVAASRAFHFSPAVHGGEAVGQWVEFDVRFRVERSEPFLSDLYLVPSETRPADAADLGLLPSRDVAGLEDVPGRSELGVFFRLHELPEGADYELRITLDALRTGERTRLRFRPAAAGILRSSWTLSAGDGPVASEYVVVDFSDVRSGEYVLHVEAAIEGSDRIVHSTRRLRVR